MNVIDDIKEIGHRMVGEQASLKEMLADERVIKVTDSTVNGVDRLIYNHCLNKSALASSLEMARGTLVKHLDAFEKDGAISEPILQSKSHLYSRHAIKEIQDLLGMPTYSDKYNKMAFAITNQKGGTGKSSTATTLAVALALDIGLNARICLVDLDPQGTLAANLIQGYDSESMTLTAVDIALGQQELDGEFQEYLEAGYDESEIVKAAPFSTHLPNLDIMASHPNDERFNDEVAKATAEGEIALYERFRDVLMANLKEEYDIVIVDTAPHDAPIVWAMNECVDGVLVPVTPNEFDYSSTANFISALPRRLNQLPSKGANLKWLKFLAVNYNDKSAAQQRTLDKLTRTVQDKMMSATINRSELFPAAAAAGRTVLDVMKSEGLVSDKQFELAISSVNGFYRQFKTEMIKIAAK